MEDQVREFVIVDPEELDHARRIASDNGVDLEQLEVGALEPVTTVTLIVMGSSLAVATVVYLLDKHKGGHRHGRKGDGGGEEPKGMFGQVIDAIRGILSDAAKTGVALVAKAVEDTVGNAGSVTVTPAA